jgi:hypothetical protein
MDKGGTPAEPSRVPELESKSQEPRESEMISPVAVSTVAMRTDMAPKVRVRFSVKRSSPPEPPVEREVHLKGEKGKGGVGG